MTGDGDKRRVDSEDTGVEGNRMVMVSVVIPVYNAERYIEECLDSLLRQTCSDFEVICVDDGSGDRSLEILRSYEKRDGRISVLTQKNQYAGVARNAGMERANGKYLLFLDADDFFREDMLEQAVGRAEEGNTEVLVFDAIRYDDRTKRVLGGSWKVLSKELFGEGIKPSAELSDVIYQFTTSAPWNKLFLREYVERNRFRFQALPRTNDLFFTYAALSCTERIGALNEKLLYYRVNNGASLQGNLDASPAVFAEALYALKDFLKERGVWEVFRGSFTEMAAAVCVNSVTNLHTEKLYLELCKKLKEEIMPALELSYEAADGQLMEAVRQGRKLVVYGAGAAATALVRYLLVCRRYEKEKIRVAVTSLQNSGALICGIRIEEIGTVDADRKETLAVTAVSEENMQKEMEACLRERGFLEISRCGYGEMMELLRRE